MLTTPTRRSVVTDRESARRECPRSPASNRSVSAIWCCRTRSRPLTSKNSAAAPRPKMPGTFRLPASNLYGTRRDGYPDRFGLPSRLGARRRFSHTPGATYNSPVPSGREPLCPGAASKSQPTSSSGATCPAFAPHRPAPAPVRGRHEHFATGWIAPVTFEAWVTTTSRVLSRRIGRIRPDRQIPRHRTTPRSIDTPAQHIQVAQRPQDGVVLGDGRYDMISRPHDAMIARFKAWVPLSVKAIRRGSATPSSRARLARAADTA